MKVQVCKGKMCSERFSEYIESRLLSDVRFYKLKNIFVENCPCTGNCKDGPTVLFDKNTELHMDPAKASDIMRGKKKKNKKRKYKK